MLPHFPVFVFVFVFFSFSLSPFYLFDCFHFRSVDSSSCVDFILGVLLEYIDQLQEVTRFDANLITLIVFTSVTKTRTRGIQHLNITIFKTICILIYF